MIFASRRVFSHGAEFVNDNDARTGTGGADPSSLGSFRMYFDAA